MRLNHFILHAGHINERSVVLVLHDSTTNSHVKIDEFFN